MLTNDCTPAHHEHLRAHPELLDNVRPWEAAGLVIGECPACGSTLAVDADEDREAA